LKYAFNLILQFFYLINLVPIFLFLFILFEIILKIIFFYNFIFLHFLFLFFYCEFFLKKYIFFWFHHSTLNWVSWLSSNLEFNEFWIWEIKFGLRELLRFICFFFKLVFFQCHLSTFNLIGDWALFFFSIEFFTNFENDPRYLGSFYFSFFIKFSFIKRNFGFEWN
jgi:hypothetical protein